MKPRADGLRLVRVYKRDGDWKYPWIVMFERHRARMSTIGKTKLAAMKDAVRLSNQALAHELAQEPKR